MVMLSSLWVKLRNPKYRHAFVAAQLKRGVPFQIRAMRSKLGLTQGELAERSGLKQGTISRCEDPNYGKLSFKTALAIAKGLDCAFVGRFVPFTDLARWHDDLSEESSQVATFTEEDEQLSAFGNPTVGAPSSPNQEAGFEALLRPQPPQPQPPQPQPLGYGSPSPATSTL